MFKREIKFNLKSFLIWSIILIGIFLVVYLVYPSIIESENIQMMDEMVAIFPEEILKAFNMDIASMDSAYGWLKTEGFVFVLLIIGSYAGILGSNILLKEENDKTVEYINSLPIKRKKIVCSKFLVGIIYILIMVGIFGIFNYIALTYSGEFDKKQFILLSITPLLPSIVIFSICIFISTFMNKTKKMLGISLGIVFVSYILQALSEMSDATEFLKYFSVFTLADVRNVIVDISINPVMVVVSIMITLIFIIATLVHYDNKDLI